MNCKERKSREEQSAKPHGQTDEVMPPKKLVLALPTSNREPTLSGKSAAVRRRALWLGA
ncbi:MAG: hypothetical protein IJF84_07190 [Thermoguttaceae bacterium]|nr:hypothetical protein [Thermoguttaceae bacterium]